MQTIRRIPEQKIPQTHNRNKKKRALTGVEEDVVAFSGRMIFVSKDVVSALVTYREEEAGAAILKCPYRQTETSENSGYTRWKRLSVLSVVV